MAARENCWEFNKCGREPGGSRTGETGVCAATTAVSCSGLYHGQNAGRMCWAIAGTFAAGRITGANAREFTCLNCDFLKNVWREEDICDFELLTPFRIYNLGSRMFGRRDFMRIEVHLDLKISPREDMPRNYIEGVTINFACEGFSFISENFTPASQVPLVFKIKLPRKKSDARVSGDLVWKTEIRDRCIAGVKILVMDEEAKRELLDYSYDRWIEGLHFL